jgi:hypothetical protein
MRFRVIVVLRASLNWRPVVPSVVVRSCYCIAREEIVPSALLTATPNSAVVLDTFG